MTATIDLMTASATREQTSAMTRQASTFVIETRRALDSMELLLDNPGRSTEHSYAEMIRLAAQVRQNSQVYAEHLALTAYREPTALSLRRIATALGVSVNTFRRRLDSLQRDEEDDPFQDHQGGDA